MRFEKLTENKIRITLSNDDLVKKEIDFHSFMANSIESQDLFFDMLDEAEKELGFVTKDYRIRIEALVVSGGDFVITVTRSVPNEEQVSISRQKVTPRKKVHIKRKTSTTNCKNVVYLFDNFDDFCSYSHFLENENIDFKKFAKSIILYEYKASYYLVFNTINVLYPNLKSFLSSITEFASHVNNSELFTRKLTECGKIIMKNNAITTCMKHF